ncbi:putative 2-aminoethylphosphonate ABC transporter permease subunit [Niveispirillum sp. SYP-B3756]|uniref:putative 2-aminoethylphosphonate ABC transporter permease subunit n=1 Tax=Niveispirillum sp. SYP-B3756 TaxID=2662178 RepID=UPI001290E84D|nr:putative 2-aminoethylphosphonate ABC transporter permease subunit [Niveispirillum sp. SYP-B3756]MQP66421.1 putative 2-aminoethylphosphonate ABC transporter permease subunit [Niveispirillum sp. SYP-B3756]
MTIAPALPPSLAAGTATVPRPGLRSPRPGAVMAILLPLLFLVPALLLPLASVLSKAVQDRAGSYVGLANLTEYLSSPHLAQSLSNSLTLSGLSAGISVALAFLYAYGLTRTRVPGRGFFALVAQLPLLAPSLLPGISLVYLFGNQGWLKGWLGGHSIYGSIGIVMGEVFWTFPHAVMILTAALSLADARLYEAARALKAGPWRRFLTVTLPGVRAGLVSAFVAVFAMVITDFGVPKVIGGNTPLLATDIYKQVIGQQNFQRGAIVALLLLLPALIAFLVDRAMAAKPAAMMGGKAVALVPDRQPWLDRLFFLFCALMAVCLLAIPSTALFASLAKLWPYNLTPGLWHYRFEMMDGGGWDAYANSVRLSALVALFGTLLIFPAAWLVAKGRAPRLLRQVPHALALLPLAVPGLVLGLGYVFFLADPGNPLRVLNGTLTLLVVCTIAHYYSVPHLSAITALRRLSPELEEAGRSLKVPALLTLWRVTLPMALPVVLDMAAYLFMSAMTTVSAVVFLYTPDTMLASLSVLAMDDAGDTAPAAAMAMLIFFTGAALRAAWALMTRGLLRRARRWQTAPAGV